MRNKHFFAEVVFLPNLVFLFTNVQDLKKKLIQRILIVIICQVCCTFQDWMKTSVQFNSVQLLSRVRLFVTPWITAHQASLSITNSWSLPKTISIESMMPSNHLILCRSLLLLPSIFPSIRVFPMSQLFASDGQSMEFQLQHQSLQWIFRTDLL